MEGEGERGEWREKGVRSEKERGVSGGREVVRSEKERGVSGGRRGGGVRRREG